MYVIMRDGTVIENAIILAASSGDHGWTFAISGDGGHTGTWTRETAIQTIRFDRDTVEDPAPDPGPEDFKIGTRHPNPERDELFRSKFKSE